MIYDYNPVPFDTLKGLTITKIMGANKYSESILFTTKEDREFNMHHNQNCCESVYVEDIIGDVNDLLNTPILLAEVSESRKNPEGVQLPEYQDSFTWTFYKLSTIKGSVTIRWYGSSNGYYSESVELEELK